MNNGFDLKKVRELMKEISLDCIIANSHDNVYYTSNSDISTITNLKRIAVVVIPIDSEPVFGIHANEEVTARQSTWIKDLRVYKGGEWESLIPIEFIAEVLKEKGFSKAKIGIEKLEMPGLWLDYLRDLLPSAKFVECQSIFDKMRSIKSSDELKLLSKASLVTAKAITVAFEMAQPGDTERKIAQNMMRLTLEYGADNISFVLLGAGKNIFENHHIPGNYRIKKGDLIHTDFGALFNGYLSDISRMAIVGKPNSTQIKAYDITVKAESTTVEAMRAGSTVLNVYNAAKDFYKSQGFDYKFPFVGHSIGIGCHEVPFLGPSHGDWILKPGMFFQVEPVLQIGDARIHTEDSIIITKSKAKNVSMYRDVTELQIIR